MPLKIVKEDILKMHVDAIVCPTDKRMSGGDGLDYRVHQLAVKEMEEACKVHIPIGLGEAKLTSAFALPCKHIIHVGVPKWNGGLDAERIILRESYLQTLSLARMCFCSSVAIPLMGADGYGYPKEEIFDLAVKAISDFLKNDEMEVHLCINDKNDYVFKNELYEELCGVVADAYDYSPSRIIEDACGGFDSLEIDLCVNASEKYRKAPQKHGRARILSAPSFSIDDSALIEYILQRDKSFQEKLFALIDARGMTDVECYKKANVDRRTFSKIKSNANYQPSKQTAVAFAIALQLDLGRTLELLATAGYTLSQSKVFDKIIRYFIHKENYNVFEINQALFEFDQPLLGSV